MSKTMSVTDTELKTLARNAVYAMRVILVNGEAYLDGGKVRDPRIAKALAKALRATQTNETYEKGTGRDGTY